MNGSELQAQGSGLHAQGSSSYSQDSALHAQAQVAKGLADVPSLEAAYRHCYAVTRRSGSSFAAAFWMLPRTPRRALHAIYAFCRLADDIADDPEVSGDRGALLARWRQELTSVYAGVPTHPVGVALADAVRRFELPESEFAELLRGVESDLLGETLKRPADVERYCDRVASTVGRLVVRLLGARNEQSLAYATEMGIAVQLTNILRDVAEDASSGRVYLAAEELDTFGVTPEALRAHCGDRAVRELLSLYAGRAHHHYDCARQLLPVAQRRKLRPAQAMGGIYRELLIELQARDFPARPLRLSRARRLGIAGAVWLGWRT